MESNQNVTEGRVTKLTNVQAPDFVSTYSNNVAFALNFFDLAMIFGEMIAFQEGAATVEQKVRVVMSMPHAKLFTMLLIHQLQQYEARFGAVSLPPLEGLAPEIQDIIKKAAEEIKSEG